MRCLGRNFSADTESVLQIHKIIDRTVIFAPLSGWVAHNRNYKIISLPAIFFLLLLLLPHSVPMAQAKMKLETRTMQKYTMKQILTSQTRKKWRNFIVWKSINVISR